MKDIVIDSYTGEIISEANSEIKKFKGGKEGRICGVQEHIEDAPTQAVKLLETAWDLGYFGIPGMEAMLLLGELKDVAELGYVFEDNPRARGDNPSWKCKKLPKKDWEETPDPEAFEEKASKIMAKLRRLSLAV